MRIQKREHYSKVQRRIVKGIFTAACMGVMMWCMPSVSLADATGKVIPNSVNIRKSPDTNSEKIGSSTIGNSVTIKGKVDVSGTTWYQVYIDANTLGYIRSDMIDLEDEAEIPVVSVAAVTPASETPAQTDDSSQAAQTDDSSQEAQADNSSGGAAVAADESMDLQYAKVKVNAKVRPEPSTKKNSIGGLSEGTQVVVSGKSAGSDGKTWYYVTYTGTNGSEKTGFVREDLLDLGDMVAVEEPPQEETPEEAPAPEPSINNDYELRLEANEEGGLSWYLYDNIEGDTYELMALLESASSSPKTDDKSTAAVVKQRIVIVILVALLVALIVAVVIMAFKLRDAYYEDYEDDEEEEEEEEERSAGRRTRSAEPAAESRRPARRSETAEAGDRRRGERGERTERRTSRERAYGEEEAQERSVKTAPKRRSKNFLLDDDEFEFEFLNMEDKDLT